MKAVLLSAQPQWCLLMANGKKLIELRKTKPNVPPPFKCYIYCTNKKPYLVWGDVFRGSWGTEFTFISGYSREKAEEIWSVFNGKVMGEFICDEIIDFESEFWDDETYERIQKIVKDHEYYAEYGEYERETVSTNEDENYKENWLCKQSCVSWEEMRKYIGSGIKEFYGWHISDLVIYDEPRELREFYIECQMNCEHCEMWGYTRVNADEFDMDCKSDWFNHKPLKRPPQSWCYVEELKNDKEVDPI